MDRSKQMRTEVLGGQGDVIWAPRKLKRTYPELGIEPPHGDGQEGSSYMHLIVIMLEWQALEDL